MKKYLSTALLFLSLFISILNTKAHQLSSFESPYPEYGFITKFLKDLACEFLGCSINLYITQSTEEHYSDTIYLPAITYHDKEISKKPIVISPDIYPLYVNDIYMKNLGNLFYNVKIEFEIPTNVDDRETYLLGSFNIGFSTKKNAKDFIETFNQYYDNDFKLINIDGRFNCTHTDPKQLTLLCLGEDGIWWEEV